MSERIRKLLVFMGDEKQEFELRDIQKVTEFLRGVFETGQPAEIEVRA